MDKEKVAKWPDYNIRASPHRHPNESTIPIELLQPQRSAAEKKKQRREKQKEERLLGHEIRNAFDFLADEHPKARRRDFGTQRSQATHLGKHDHRGKVKSRMKYRS